MLAVGLLVCGLSLTQSCATIGAVRWSYNLGPSVEEREPSAIKPFVAVPLIGVALAWDAFTLPIQVMTGTWPWWGGASRHMKPSED